MTSGQLDDRRTTVGTDAFVSAALQALFQHRKSGKLLRDFRWKTEHQTFNAADLVRSHKFLKAALNSIRSADIELELKRVRTHLDDLEKTDFDPAEAIRRIDAVIEAMENGKPNGSMLGSMLSNRQDFDPEALRRTPFRKVKIPKEKFRDLDIRPETLVAILESDQSSADIDPKGRTIQIAPLPLRVLGSSMAMVLGATMSSQLGSSVVGYRPGPNIGRILGTLNQAVKRSRRYWALTADLSSFFDNIPTTEALTDLGHRCGMDERLVKLAVAVTGFNGRPEHRLPQGSPLSPMLANLYAVKRIDPALQRLGPYLRYSDDIIMLLKSRDEALAAFAQLQHVARSAGLDVNPAKTRITDLRTGQGSSPATPETREPGDLLYLGVALGWISSNKGLSFSVSSLAIRRLAERLRAALHDPGRGSPTLLEIGVHHFELCLQIWRGWFGAYGGLHWNQEHMAAIAVLAAESGMTSSTFKEMTAALAQRCGREPDVVVQVLEEVLGREGLHPLQYPIEKIRADQVSRFQKHLDEYVALVWGPKMDHRTSEHYRAWDSFDWRSWRAGGIDVVEIGQVVVNSGGLIHPGLR